MEKDVELVANPAEVKLIHRIPLQELLREEAPILDSIKESRHPVLRMPLGEDWFAAPSAAIAYQFREVALLRQKYARIAFRTTLLRVEISVLRRPPMRRTGASRAVRRIGLVQVARYKIPACAGMTR